MTDVRTLLRASAPSPHRDLDVGAIVARARRRSPWRRVGPGLAAIAALAGLAGGAGSGILSPAGSPQRLQTGPAPAVEISETVPDGTGTEADGPSETGVAPTSASPSSGTTASTAPANGFAAGHQATPSGDGDGHQATPSGDGSASSAENEGCVAEPGDDNDLTGLATGGREYPECSYVATRPGGYIANGRWRIEIEKPDGAVYELTSARIPDCADPGFWIMPGDRVTAILVTGVGDMSTDSWFVMVGSSYGCDS